MSTDQWSSDDDYVIIMIIFRIVVFEVWKWQVAGWWPVPHAGSAVIKMSLNPQHTLCGAEHQCRAWISWLRQAGALRMFTTRGERSNLWHHLGRRPQGMAPLLLVVIVIINGWFVSLSINYRYILRKLQASSPLHCLSTEQFLISRQTK